MKKPSQSFQKRQREMARKQKKEEKRQKKLEKKLAKAQDELNHDEKSDDNASILNSS